MVITDCDKVLDDDNSTPTIVVLRFSQTEMDDLLANYDAVSATSPSVTYCRPIVRAILDRVKEVANAGS
jgi:hypothetical protein